MKFEFEIKTNLTSLCHSQSFIVYCYVGNECFFWGTNFS